MRNKKVQRNKRYKNESNKDTNIKNDKTDSKEEYKYIKDKVDTQEGQKYTDKNTKNVNNKLCKKNNIEFGKNSETNMYKKNKAEIEAEAETQTEIEAETEAETETQSETQTETETETETETKMKTKRIKNIDRETEIENEEENSTDIELPDAQEINKWKNTYKDTDKMHKEQLSQQDEYDAKTIKGTNDKDKNKIQVLQVGEELYHKAKHTVDDDTNTIKEIVETKEQSMEDIQNVQSKNNTDNDMNIKNADNIVLSNKPTLPEVLQNDNTYTEEQPSLPKTQPQELDKIIKQLKYKREGLIHLSTAIVNGSGGGYINENDRKRIERIANYEKQQDQVSIWEPIIENNRLSKQLVYPDILYDNTLDENKDKDKDNKIALNEPITEQEKDQKMILNTYGIDEDRQQKEEEEYEKSLQNDSDTNINEYRYKIREMRTQMLSQEEKQRRIKKIKSKTYRRIKRKEKERSRLSIEEQNEIDPEQAEKELIRLEQLRARERATLNHKLTSKWSQRLKKKNIKGESGDLIKQSQKEQLKISRMQQQRVRSDDHDDTATTDDDDIDINNNKYIKKFEDAKDSDEEQEQMKEEQNVIKNDLNITDNILNDKTKNKIIYEKDYIINKDIVNNTTDNTIKSSLLSYPFMKRAEENKKQETLKILNEAENDLLFAVDDFDPVVDEDNDSNSDAQKLKNIQYTSIIPSIQNNKVNSISSVGTSAQFDVEIYSTSDNAKECEKDSNILNNKKNEVKTALELAQSIPSIVTSSKVNILGKYLPAATSTVDDKEILSDKETSKDNKVKIDTISPIKNPWLKDNTNRSNINTTKILIDTEKHEQKVNQKNIEYIQKKDEKYDGEKITDIKYNDKNQEKQISQAFDQEDEFTKKFTDDKNKNIDEEQEIDNTDGISNTIPGWGTWGGCDIHPNQKKKQEEKERQSKELQDKKKQILLKSRPDYILENVLQSQKKDDKILKYCIPNVPNSYNSKEQYEKSIRVPQGKDWNTNKAYRRLTAPSIIKRNGIEIPVMQVPKKIREEQERVLQSTTTNTQRKGSSFYNIEERAYQTIKTSKIVKASKIPKLVPTIKGTFTTRADNTIQG